jgi:hypothetical protein
MEHTIYLRHRGLSPDSVEIPTEVEIKTVADGIDKLKRYALPGTGFQLVTPNGKARKGNEQLNAYGNTLYYTLDKVNSDEVRKAFDNAKACMEHSEVQLIRRRDILHKGIYYHYFEILLRSLIIHKRYSELTSKKYYEGEDYCIPYVYGQIDPFRIVQTPEVEQSSWLSAIFHGKFMQKPIPPQIVEKEIEPRAQAKPRAQARSQAEPRSQNTNEDLIKELRQLKQEVRELKNQQQQGGLGLFPFL